MNDNTASAKEVSLAIRGYGLLAAVSSFSHFDTVCDNGRSWKTSEKQTMTINPIERNDSWLVAFYKKN